MAAELARLNLGCGADIDPDMVNVDLAALPGVDLVADLDAPPWPWKDASVAYIKASHVFEHVADPVCFMTEAWRVLGPGGLLDIRVPYYRHPFAFTDPTHRRFCTELTWDYWVAGRDLHTAYGAAMGSGAAVYEMRHLSLNGQQGEELQVILAKEGGGECQPSTTTG